MRNARIAIIGAGPAGLTAALVAGRLGLETTVFEQAPDFRRIGGGLMLQSNGLRVLQWLELLESFSPCLRLTPHLRVEIAGGKILFHTDLSELAIPHNHCAVVRRYELQEHLLAAALRQGVPIRFDHRLTGLSCQDGGAVLSFAAGQEYEADVVLACDGARSRSREALGLPAQRTALGLGALRGVVAVRSADDTVREIWGRDGRLFGICPLPGNQTYFFCTLPPGQWPGILKDGVADWVAGWEAFGPDVLALLRAVPDWSQLNYAELEEVRLQRWHQPPVFVVGDAAHAMAPNLGQGANCAMVDALVLMQLLARALEEGTALADVGRAYDALRRPFVTRIQRTARQFGGMARLSSAPARLLRGTLVALTRRWGWLTRPTMHLAAGYNPAETTFFDRPERRAQAATAEARRNEGVLVPPSPSGRQNE
jgi:2-polyprenyl-6-methoxyphenol hydroxylase-like FAD-dependent oxidoreductase